MINFGTVKPGTTLIIPFHTFDSNDPSASVTITGLATTDVEVYKDGGNTTRASDTGYALLGTDGIDEFGTGIHGISIDLSSNATANFYEAGSQYFAVIASITVDGATVNFVAATWRIGYAGAILDTTIATLASQVSFTLEEGPAEAGVLIGCPVIVHDLASAVQTAIGYVSAYAVTSKTVTLKADPGVFTMAAGDNVSFFMPANVQAVAGTSQTAGDLAALIATAQSDLDTLTGSDGATLATTQGNYAPAKAGDLMGLAADAITAAKIADNAIATEHIATGAITADSLGADAITAAKVAADVHAETADAVLDEATSGHTTAGTLGKAVTDILADTNELQGDWVDAGRLDALIDAIKVATDKLVFTSTGRVDANVEAINDDTDAADKLAAHALETLPVTFTTTGGSTTAAVLNQVDGAAASTTDDVYIGRILVFNIGTLNHQVAEITDYVGSTKTATISAVTSAPTASHTARMV